MSTKKERKLIKQLRDRFGKGFGEIYTALRMLMNSHFDKEKEMIYIDGMKKGTDGSMKMIYEILKELEDV